MTEHGQHSPDHADHPHSAAEWDERYSSADRLWTAQANPALVREAADLSPGRAPERLVAKYGLEAPAILALADADPRWAAPVAEGTEITGAELLVGALAEGAVDADDLLERRTRLALTPAVAAAAAPTAEQVLAALH